MWRGHTPGREVDGVKTRSVKWRLDRLYQPLYWLSGVVKVITAIASVTAAIALPPQLPIVLRMIVNSRCTE